MQPDPPPAAAAAASAAAASAAAAAATSARHELAASLSRLDIPALQRLAANFHLTLPPAPDASARVISTHIIQAIPCPSFDHVAYADLLHQCARPSGRQWSVYELKDGDSSTFTPSSARDWSDVAAEASSVLEPFMQHHAFAWAHGDQLWLRIRVSPAAGLGGRVCTVYFVSYPRSPYIMCNGMQAKHSAAMLHALTVALGCPGLQKTTIQGKHVASLLSLLLQRDMFEPSLLPLFPTSTSGAAAINDPPSLPNALHVVPVKRGRGEGEEERQEALMQLLPRVSKVAANIELPGGHVIALQFTGSHVMHGLVQLQAPQGLHPEISSFPMRPSQAITIKMQ